MSTVGVANICDTTTCACTEDCPEESGRRGLARAHSTGPTLVRLRAHVLGLVTILLRVRGRAHGLPLAWALLLLPAVAREGRLPAVGTGCIMSVIIGHGGEKEQHLLLLERNVPLTDSAEPLMLGAQRDERNKAQFEPRPGLYADGRS